jgi:RNA polymerase sigma-70 factor (ECF subfamily)
MGMHQGTNADVNRPHDDLLRHDIWMRRLARSLVGNDADGDDVAQEVMIAAAQHPPDARGSVQPWLRAVARNRAVNEARAARRRASREAASAPPEAPASPEELALRRELQRLLAGEIARLAEPYREIVMLRYFDGLSSREIGARARLPAATVRTRLKTAWTRCVPRSTRTRMGAHVGRRRWRRWPTPPRPPLQKLPLPHRRRHPFPRRLRRALARPSEHFSEAPPLWPRLQPVGGRYGRRVTAPIRRATPGTRHNRRSRRDQILTWR